MIITQTYADDMCTNGNGVYLGNVLENDRVYAAYDNYLDQRTDHVLLPYAY